jgi:hypothetical protein
LANYGTTTTERLAIEGGTLSYQWYSNTTTDNSGGTAISDKTSATFADVPTSVIGTFYYYVVVTNTIADNGDGGVKTASTSSAVTMITITTPVATTDADREIPPTGMIEETAVIAPMNISAAKFTAGPNPVNRSNGTVNFYRCGKQVKNTTLLVYDASGNLVKKVRISDNAFSTDARRQVGSWDLTDKRGRPVSDGTYLVRGAVAPLYTASSKNANCATVKTEKNTRFPPDDFSNFLIVTNNAADNRSAVMILNVSQGMSFVSSGIP